MKPYLAVVKTSVNLRKGLDMTKFSAFLKDEAGAVTVDWVVLTAAIVTFGLLIFTWIRPAVSELAVAIDGEMERAQGIMIDEGAAASAAAN
jgi:Flp pilus assembly pilin Flp